MYVMWWPFKILNINQVIKCIILTTWFRASLCRARNPEGGIVTRLCKTQKQGYEGKRKDINIARGTTDPGYSISGLNKFSD